MANEFIIKNGFHSKGNSELSGSLTFNPGDAAVATIGNYSSDGNTQYGLLNISASGMFLLNQLHVGDPSGNFFLFDPGTKRFDAPDFGSKFLNVTASGAISASGLLFASASEGYPHTTLNVIAYDTASGQFYYTGSTAIGSSTPTLQQVTTAGNITTQDIFLHSAKFLEPSGQTGRLKIDADSDQEGLASDAGVDFAVHGTTNVSINNSGVSANAVSASLGILLTDTAAGNTARSNSTNIIQAPTGTNTGGQAGIPIIIKAGRSTGTGARGGDLYLEGGSAAQGIGGSVFVLGNAGSSTVVSGSVYLDGNTIEIGSVSGRNTPLRADNISGSIVTASIFTLETNGLGDDHTSRLNLNNSTLNGVSLNGSAAAPVIFSIENNPYFTIKKSSSPFKSVLSGSGVPGSPGHSEIIATSGSFSEITGNSPLKINVGSDTLQIIASNFTVATTGEISSGGSDGVSTTSITASGDISSSGDIYGNSFVKGGGTSTQFLKADGSVDSNTYSTATGVENNADVTDTANVTSAGALMDSEVTNLSFVKGLAGGISEGNVFVATADVADNDFLRVDGTSVEGLTAAEVRTAINVEDGADVTDETNVTAAGALMDSEVTDLAGIKAVTISTLQVKPSEGAFANGDKTKLDGIENSADVTDTANVTSAGALMASNNLSDLNNAGTARSNLGLGSFATISSLAFSSLTGKPTTIAGYGITDSLQIGTTSTTALAGDTTVGTVVAANPGAGIYDTLERITIGGTSFNIPAGTGNGTVTSVGGTGTVSGLTLTGTVTNSGNLTLGGTLSVDLTSDVTGVLPSANMDSDTAHLTGTQTFSGAKIFSSGITISGNNYINFAGSAGGGGEGIRFLDTSDGNREALHFPGNDLVVLSNRSQNGIVEIRSNTSTVGSSGETLSARFTATGSFVSKSLEIDGSGSGIFNVEGSVGTLFSVDDGLDDVIFAANNVSGTPVISANADNTVKLGKLGGFGIVISGSTPAPSDDDAKIIITGSLEQKGTSAYFNSAMIVGSGTAANTTNGKIVAANDVVAFSSSDKRWKENVKPIDNALDKVSKIGGYEFDWKELTEEEKKTQHSNEGHDIGVIAQEIEEVLPEVVTTRDNGYKAVKYEKIIPLLVEAIKELQEEIKELKKSK